MEAKVSMGQVMSRVTMHVKITDARSFAWRQRLGIALMKLAALVIGCSIEVDLGSYPPIPEPFPAPDPPEPPRYRTHNDARAARLKAKA